MELLQNIFSNLWAIFLVILFFGGSIFVHELGHFLAARRRGMHVDRFSIGFGPKIFSWTGKDGVEYRVSWLPLGGYVALPQLADMRGIEGETRTDLSKLPPPSYLTKVIVSVAGAAFNILFAFLLATVLFLVGVRVTEEEQTTRVGVVLPTIELPSGKEVDGPAFLAGIKPGDEIKAVDGKSVSSMSEISYLIALGSGRGPKNEPMVELTIVRDGNQLAPIKVFPQYVSTEKIRDIGLEPTMKVMIGDVKPGGAADAAGLKAGDIVTAIDGQPITYTAFLPEYLRKNTGKPFQLTYVRDDVTKTIEVTPAKLIDPDSKLAVFRIGVSLRGAPVTKIANIPPWEQIWQHAQTTWRTVVSLVSPKSDIGLSKMSGPIGIAKGLHSLAKIDFRLVMWFTVLINVNLAIFNLLPIPVLDGGHIMFATIGKLRGKALPTEFIVTTQSVFMVLLFSMIIYVSFFDVRRIVHDEAEDKPQKTSPAKPESVPKTAPESAPSPAAP
ncbi:MAG: RIP metalloprotease RseP [Nibricoccus sp.]